MNKTICTSLLKITNIKPTYAMQLKINDGSGKSNK